MTGGESSGHVSIVTIRRMLLVFSAVRRHPRKPTCTVKLHENTSNVYVAYLVAVLLAYIKVAAMNDMQESILSLPRHVRDG